MEEIHKKNTLIILDWDDTLFPTNWVFKNNIDLMDSNIREQYTTYFQELDRVLYIFLTTCMTFGKIIIITNALLDWVNISSMILPKTYAILKKIKIVSARSSYKTKNTTIMDWKMLAFNDVVKNKFKNQLLMHVISVGDAEYEYNALISLNKHELQHKYLKSIKFIKDPTHDTLIEQLELLNIAIKDIYFKKQHLDLLFRVNKK
jgi:hypothetical protein